MRGHGGDAGPLRDDGEGLGVTQMSSGAADDVLAGTGGIGCCPGPRPPTGGRPLDNRIYVLKWVVKGFGW